MSKSLIDGNVLDKIKKIPIFDTLDFKIRELNDGICKVKIPRQIKYDGIFESVHGWILMTIADSIAAFAILSKTGIEGYNYDRYEYSLFRTL